MVVVVVVGCWGMIDRPAQAEDFSRQILNPMVKACVYSVKLPSERTNGHVRLSVVREQTDKHQGRQFPIYETAGVTCSLEPAQNGAFCLKTE